MGTKTFTLRLNDEQHELLEKKSNQLNVSKNDFIRNLIENEARIDKQEEILAEIKEIKQILKKK